MEKIDDLIEQTANILLNKPDGFYEIEDYRKLAKQIFSHPDLYLLDTSQPSIDTGVADHIIKRAISNKVLISLSKEIKSKDDD